MSEEEKEAIKIIEETHDMLVNPKLREEKYTTDDFEKAFYVVIMLIRKQQKEIEEKTTILLAGAEKVKQLEKGNRSLMESRIKWKNRYYKEKAKNKECISKDKIREIIEHYNIELEHIKNGEEFENEKPMYYWGKVALENLLEEK